MHEHVAQNANAKHQLAEEKVRFYHQFKPILYKNTNHLLKRNYRKSTEWKFCFFRLRREKLKEASSSAVPGLAWGLQNDCLWPSGFISIGHLLRILMCAGFTILAITKHQAFNTPMSLYIEY